MAGFLLGYTARRQLSQFLAAIVFFHGSEYALAIAFHGRSNVSLSSLLISKHYVLSMTCALLEYIIEILLVPELKEYWWVSNIGLVMVLIGEVIRKSAILTAKRAFTHTIRIYYEDHHELITRGIYRFMRHPGYCGFFIWAIGNQVYLHGGHVTSWKSDHGEELLFVSNKAIFKPPKAIRGGIPICFPQFGSHGTLEQHGFARNRLWSVDTDPPPFPTNSCDKVFIDLILKSSEEDSKIWPHSYEFRLRVALGPGGDLMLTSRIRNTNKDGKPFSFTFAYHTYFSVSDISEVRVEGLETMDYFDNLKQKERFTEQGDAITFESEVDKIYLSTPTKIAILDHEKKRTFVLRKDGLPDAVVWNPWDKKAKAMQDFGDEEYKHMLCIEAAAIEKPITLKPGEEWKGRLELSTVPSSYCSGQLDPQKVLQG